MNRAAQNGFTVSELVIVLGVLFLTSFFAYTQWQYFQLVAHNTDRKKAINAMHYYLQEVYFPKHDAYPPRLDPESIQAISQDALRDPRGRPVTSQHSDLRYQPGDCRRGSCERYTLRADLEQAEDFVRRGN